MAKRRKKIAALTTARGAQAKRRAKVVKNPESAALVPAGMGAFGDLLNVAIPGFAGYATTRLIARIAYVQLSKKWPSAARHLAAGSTAGSFLAAWYLLPKFKKFEPYAESAALGAAIAALQTLVQTYLPKFGWMVSDYQTPGKMAGATTATVPQLSPEQVAELEGYMDDDDESEDLVDPLKAGVTEPMGDEDDLGTLGLN